MLYAIQAGAGGPIKIGFSDDPQARLSAIQIGNHAVCRIIFLMEGGMADEAALHEELASDHIRGEWFWPTRLVFSALEARSPRVVDEPPAVNTDGVLSVDRLVDALGGTMTVSAFLGALPSAVSNWRSRNSIPSKHWRQCVALAAQQGIQGVTLDAFAAAASKDAA